MSRLIIIGDFKHITVLQYITQYVHKQVSIYVSAVYIYIIKSYTFFFMDLDCRVLTFLGNLSKVDRVKMPIYMTKPIIVFLLERDLHNGCGTPSAELHSYVIVGCSRSIIELLFTEISQKLLKQIQ